MLWKMYNYTKLKLSLVIFTILVKLGSGCDSGICPGSFPNKTLFKLFDTKSVTTCCSGLDSYIYTDFCDVSSYTISFVYASVILKTLWSKNWFMTEGFTKQ